MILKSLSHNMEPDSVKCFINENATVSLPSCDNSICISDLLRPAVSMMKIDDDVDEK